MLLRVLTQLNFRNLQTRSLKFGPGLTVITGANGAGKSNLLAACYLCLTAELPFGRIASAVRLGEEEAFVSAQFDHEDGSSLVEVGLGPGRRRVQLDGHTVRAEQLAAVAAGVLITPEDAQLVHGSPSGRRSWLDSLLGRLSQRYARLHAEYNRVLAQRNALLRHGQHDDSLEIWSGRFVKLGTEIEDLRARATRRLAELAAAAYLEVTESGTSEERRQLTIRLQSAGREPLAEALARTRAEELARGVTVVGPHRDDLLLELAGHSVQEFGSRGEARTVALALKVAEFRLLSERHREQPVLLLDDFAAELDENRRTYLLGMARSVDQVLATATEAPAGLEASQHFFIRAGSVEDGG